MGVVQKRAGWARWAVWGAVLVLFAAPAQAHVSEQGLMLLLPTEIYITSGVLAVLASIILISLTPKRLVAGLFQARLSLPIAAPRWVAEAVSLVALVVCAGLVFIGITGPRDPLTNLLPLSVWTGFWIILFSAVGLAGNLWRALNPWSGLYALLIGRDQPGLLPLPKALGVGPALVTFIAFSSFYIVDPAPDDPDRLAVVAALYWVFTFAAMVAFGGQDWLQRGEAFSVLFGLLARVSPFGAGGKRALGVPGWDLLPAEPQPDEPQPAEPQPAQFLTVSTGVFALCALGMGTFDGLKETFWWLAQIEVNPLEFPGRTAVRLSSTLGLAAATLGLVVAFTAAIWAGERLARRGGHPPVPLARLFATFAPTVLPIALVYHMAHFWVSFLVGGQYLLAAIGDPLANGANLFGLGQTRVTTGFLNTPQSVKAIWLTQAGIVVAGHILAVLLSHAAALRLFETSKRAAISQIPIALFMIAFTLFGLWLLASPRGM